jgi:hypothetical protein
MFFRARMCCSFGVEPSSEGKVSNGLASAGTPPIISQCMISSSLYENEMAVHTVMKPFAVAVEGGKPETVHSPRLLFLRNTAIVIRSRMRCGLR